MKIPVIAQWGAVIKIRAGLVKIHTLAQGKTATGFFTSFADHIDNAAGRITGKCGGGTAANGFYPCDVRIGAQKNIRITKGDIAKLHHRQTVFLQLQNLAPPEATGKPRTLILALPSPPVASARMPGILRNISAAERGAKLAISSILTLLMDTLDSNCVTGLAVPVTITSSITSCCAAPKAGDMILAIISARLLGKKRCGVSYAHPEGKSY